MKKFAKMSLVAAVAVAGLTTANAKDLTEAIKGVDVSGTVVYRYNDYEGQNNAVAGATNNYKIGMTVKSPVNEDVAFTSRFLVANGSGSFASLNTNTAADSNVDVALSWANFTYTGLTNTSIIVGKQGLGTPWTNATDSDGSEQTGTGILALSTWGPVTAAAGYFNQTNISGSMTDGAYYGNALSDAYLGAQDLMVAALIGTFGPVTAEAWYLDLSDVTDSVFAKISGSFNVGDVKLGLFAQTTQSDLDTQYETATEKDFGLTKVGISAKLGIFGASYTYGETEKDGSGVLNSVAKNGMIAWSVSLHDEEDAKMHFATIDAQVLPELNVALKYAQVDRDNVASTVDTEEETYVELTYKMSKNLSTYLRLGEYEDETATSSSESRGRLQVQYSF